LRFLKEKYLTWELNEEDGSENERGRRNSGVVKKKKETKREEIERNIQSQKSEERKSVTSH